MLALRLASRGLGLEFGVQDLVRYWGVSGSSFGKDRSIRDCRVLLRGSRALNLELSRAGFRV